MTNKCRRKHFLLGGAHKTLPSQQSWVYKGCTQWDRHYYTLFRSAEPAVHRLYSVRHFHSYPAHLHSQDFMDVLISVGRISAAGTDGQCDCDRRVNMLMCERKALKRPQYCFKWIHWVVFVFLPMQLDVFDAAERYQQSSVPLLILAGKEYGSGSSRDWAAKGPFLLVRITHSQFVADTGLLNRFSMIWIKTI